MNFDQICWLRELVVTNAQGQDTIAFEYSCDDGYGRTPLFFPVRSEDLPQARELYREWGGNRPEGYRIGTVAKGPGEPIWRSASLWREYGNY